ncbi:MAG TPA: hypothetical protein VMI31_03530 [Fimbriimonadaceae bacterium]|nr:hypothetical protein [Fimbriimonadaceae bacterium]
MESPIFKKIESEVQSLSQAEVLDLVSYLVAVARSKQPSPRKPVDWSKYEGILTLGPDPLEFQHRIRAERD